MSSTSPNSRSAVTTQFADSWIPEPEPVEAARDRAREFGVSPVSPATGRFLTFLAASVQAQTVVEVGTGTGVSGAALLAGMTPGGVLTSIDTEAEYQRHAREALVSLGHEPSALALLLVGRWMFFLACPTVPTTSLSSTPIEVSTRPLDQAKRLRIGGVVAFLGIGEDDMVADPARRGVEAMAVKELAELMRRDADWAATPLAEGNGMLVACLRRRD